MKSVQGKNVLVTGAAMGMGRLFAERAIAEKAKAVAAKPAAPAQSIKVAKSGNGRRG